MKILLLANLCFFFQYISSAKHEEIAQVPHVAIELGQIHPSHFQSLAGISDDIEDTPVVMQDSGMVCDSEGRWISDASMLPAYDNSSSPNFRSSKFSRFSKIIKKKKVFVPVGIVSVLIVVIVSAAAAVSFRRGTAQTSLREESSLDKLFYTKKNTVKGSLSSGFSLGEADFLNCSRSINATTCNVSPSAIASGLWSADFVQNITLFIDQSTSFKVSYGLTGFCNANSACLNGKFDRQGSKSTGYVFNGSYKFSNLESLTNFIRPDGVTNQYADSQSNLHFVETGQKSLFNGDGQQLAVWEKLSNAEISYLFHDMFSDIFTVLIVVLTVGFEF